MKTNLDASAAAIARKALTEVDVQKRELQAQAGHGASKSEKSQAHGDAFDSTNHHARQKFLDEEKSKLVQGVAAAAQPHDAQVQKISDLLKNEPHKKV